MSLSYKNLNLLLSGFTCPFGQQPITARFMPSPLAAKKTNREGKTLGRNNNVQT